MCICAWLNELVFTLLSLWQGRMYVHLVAFSLFGVFFFANARRTNEHWERVSMCLLCESTCDFLGQCSHMRRHRGHYRWVLCASIHKHMPCISTHLICHFSLCLYKPLSFWWGLIPGCFSLSSPFALHPRLVHPPTLLPLHFFFPLCNPLSFPSLLTCFFLLILH